MFDSTSGKINCNGVTFWKGQTLHQFLTSEAGNIAQKTVDNNKWIAYRFSVDKKTFFVVQFNNGVIERICIALWVESDNTSWSFESEGLRKEMHDKLLFDELGEMPYRYSWGEIESVNDLKIGASQIVVRYKY